MEPSVMTGLILPMVMLSAACWASLTLWRHGEHSTSSTFQVAEICSKAPFGSMIWHAMVARDRLWTVRFQAGVSMTALTMRMSASSVQVRV